MGKSRPVRHHRLPWPVVARPRTRRDRMKPPSPQSAQRSQRISLAILCALCVLCGDRLVPAAQQSNAVSVASSKSPERAMLDQYCVTCHNERAKTANLTLDTMDLAQLSTHADVWEKVVRKLRGGLMP